jgi:hypothetical protein
MTSRPRGHGFRSRYPIIAHATAPDRIRLGAAAGEHSPTLVEAAIHDIYARRLALHGPEQQAALQRMSEEAAPLLDITRLIKRIQHDEQKFDLELRTTKDELANEHQADLAEKLRTAEKDWSIKLEEAISNTRVESERQHSNEIQALDNYITDAANHLWQRNLTGSLGEKLKQLIQVAQSQSGQQLQTKQASHEGLLERAQQQLLATAKETSIELRDEPFEVSLVKLLIRFEQRISQHQFLVDTGKNEIKGLYKRLNYALDSANILFTYNGTDIEEKLHALIQAAQSQSISLQTEQSRSTNLVSNLTEILNYGSVTLGIKSIQSTSIEQQTVQFVEQSLQRIRESERRLKGAADLEQRLATSIAQGTKATGVFHAPDADLEKQLSVLVDGIATLERNSFAKGQKAATDNLIPHVETCCEVLSLPQTDSPIHERLHTLKTGIQDVADVIPVLTSEPHASCKDRLRLHLGHLTERLSMLDHNTLEASARLLKTATELSIPMPGTEAPLQEHVDALCAHASSLEQVAQLSLNYDRLAAAVFRCLKKMYAHAKAPKHSVWPDTSIASTDEYIMWLDSVDIDFRDSIQRERKAYDDAVDACNSAQQAHQMLMEDATNLVTALAKTVHLDVSKWPQCEIDYFPVWLKERASNVADTWASHTSSSLKNMRDFEEGIAEFAASVFQTAGVGPVPALNLPVTIPIRTSLSKWTAACQKDLDASLALQRTAAQARTLTVVDELIAFAKEMYTSAGIDRDDWTGISATSSKQELRDWHRSCSLQLNRHSHDAAKIIHREYRDTGGWIADHLYAKLDRHAQLLQAEFRMQDFRLRDTADEKGFYRDMVQMRKWVDRTFLRLDDCVKLRSRDLGKLTEHLEQITVERDELVQENQRLEDDIDRVHWQCLQFRIRLRPVRR